MIFSDFSYVTNIIFIGSELEEKYWILCARNCKKIMLAKEIFFWFYSIYVRLSCEHDQKFTAVIITLRGFQCENKLFRNHTLGVS
jgi:hypothetical protein